MRIYSAINFARECFFGLFVGFFLVSIAWAQTNPIVLENQLPGSLDWEISQPANDNSLQIKAYLSAVSGSSGESIDVFTTVNPVQNYTIEVFRMGYYGGLGGRLIQTYGPISGTSQPVCPTDSITGQITCDWTSNFNFTIPSSWTTGVYLIKFTNASGFENYFPFVVRDTVRDAQLIYQQPVNTYHAYNSFPNDGATGKSFYGGGRSHGANTIAGSPRAVKVSYDRPYWDRGAQLFFAYEHETIMFLEEHGYDVEYLTNIEVHNDPSILLSAKGVVSAGHDEYWTAEIYDAFEAARDAGVNLFFVGANAAYWQVRYEPSTSGTANRVLVGYKSGSLDPEQDIRKKSALFRNLGRPEQTLVGVQYITYGVSGSDRPFVAQNTSHWIYENSGLSDGSTVPGVIGSEVDLSFSEYSGPVSTSYTVLGRSPFQGVLPDEVIAETVIYEAPSGAIVFGSGTLRWNRSLSGNRSQAPIRQMTKNLLDRFVDTGAHEGLVFTKSAMLSQTSQSPAVGDTINYTFSLSNQGQLSFSNLTLSDPLPGLSDIDCGSSTPTIGLLDPLQSVSCTASYTITQNDLNASLVSNIATVAGTSTEGTFSLVSNSVETNLPAALKLISQGTLDLGSDGVASPGDLVSYEYTITNISGSALTDISLSDSLSGLSSIDCGSLDIDLDGDIDVLADGQSASCSANYALSSSDIAEGEVRNSASVSSGVYTTVTGPRITVIPGQVSQVACGQPVIDFASEAGFFAWQDCSGDLSWHVLATAGGTSSVLTYNGSLESNAAIGDMNPVSYEGSDQASVDNLSQINFLMRMLGSGIDGIDFDTTGATSLCLSLDPNPSGHPIYLGQSKQQATLSEVDLFTGLECPSLPLPGITLSKSASLDIGADGVATPGDLIVYTFTLTNSGNTTLSDIAISDPFFGPSAFDCDGFDLDLDGDIDSLAPSAEAICTAAYPISQLDIDAGQVTNTATASDGTTTSNVATVVTSISGGVFQVSCGAPAFDASSDLGVFIWQDCDADGAWHIVTTAGGSSSVATYVGEIASSMPINGINTVSYESSDILGTPDSSSITFTMRMLLSGIDGLDFYSPGASSLCLDLSSNTAGSSIFLGENKLEVLPGGEELDIISGLECGSVPPILPSLELQKSGVFNIGLDGVVSVGDSIDYSFSITNTGNTNLSDIFVTDNLTGLSLIDCGLADSDFDGDIDSLNPLQAVTCTASYLITQADIDATEVFNAASASDGNLISNSSTTVSLTGLNPNTESCGEPAIDASQETGVFVWQDCPSGVPNGVWHFRLTAGGGGIRRYDGLISTDGNMSSVTTFSYENSDQLSGDSQQQTFLMRMLGSGVDGLDLNLSGESEFCLSLSGSTASSDIFLGENKLLRNGSTNLIDGTSCN